MKAKTKEELMLLYQKQHGNFYDYSLLDLKNKENGKVKIVCPAHGLFLQNHYDHIRAGCPQCAIERAKKKLSKILIKDLNDLIKQTTEKYGDQFDFSSAVFVNTGSSLQVRCKKHNKIFFNTAYHIIRGAGCAFCKKEKVANKKRLGVKNFIHRAKEKHGNTYDYSLVEYKNLISAVKIICPIHNEYSQKPREHLAGHGCPQCAGTTISKISQEWLAKLNIVNLVREFRIDIKDKTFFVDGYDPVTNTVYEFYGDYWHGNPNMYSPDLVNKSLDKTFGSLYNSTMLREDLLKKAGYNLITIWESDYHEVRKKNL